MIRYFSLFSGIGGFELGIQQANKSRVQMAEPSREECNILGQGNNENLTKRDAGVFCIGFSEIDKYAIQIYKNHFNHREYGNVREINWNNVEDFELLVGGFPCQAFSTAGKRRGFDDTRGTLFFEIARVAQEKQPRLLLLENVKGLLSHDKGRTFGIILNTLDELGYDLQWQVLNSKNFGVPQNRERVFIVGHFRGTSRPQIFPFRESNRAVVQMEQPIQTITKCLCARGQSDLHGGLQLIRQENIRRLTPIECERLQGFPNNWTEGVSDTQRYRCLGNAVTVNVIEAIIEKLL